MKYIFVLGRHTALSAAEIMAVLGEKGRMIIQAGRYMLVNVSSPPSLDRLGGTDRIVEILVEQDHFFTPEEIVRALPSFGEKKITLGISGLPFNQTKLLGSALKKLLRQQNKSVRFIIPKSKTPLLNAAQVLFNRLLTSQNIELVFAEIKGRYYLGRTAQIQDIQAYEARDTARPVRDAKVGMLPPKLAQIMLNLAVGHATDPAFAGRSTVYDPFCGTGVVLQEGWLLGHTMLGSDSSPKMVAASQENLKYLLGLFGSLPRIRGATVPVVFKHDVQQSFPENLRGKIDAIVTEPYLGRPLSTPLSPLRPAKRDYGGQAPQLARLYKSFFANVCTVLKPHGVILFLLPVFRQPDGTWAYFEVAFLDELAQLGYGRKQLVPTREEAVYARPDAIVGRELTLWQKR